MEQFALLISHTLITVSVFDREVNIRRAASAAMQENVGRLQGIYPHGIAIVQVADYFAVGNRGRAYLQVAGEVGRLDEGYARALVRHLVGISCGHWDKSIRDLGAKSIAELGEVAGDYIMEVAVPVLVFCFINGVSRYRLSGPSM
jgi:hypothetical protein